MKTWKFKYIDLYKDGLVIIHGFTFDKNYFKTSSNFAIKASAKYRIEMCFDTHLHFLGAATIIILISDQLTTFSTFFFTTAFGEKQSSGRNSTIHMRH